MAGKLAGGGGKKKGLAPNADPNVIPFIDIMLVLLIIFMVSAPLPTVDIKVDLPPPNAIPPDNPPEDKPTFVFLEDDAGALRYMVGPDEVTLAQIQDKLLKTAQDNNPTISGDLATLFSEAKIYVKADQETAYSNVVQVMNEIDEVGFKKVSLVAEEAAF